MDGGIGWHEQFGDDRAGRRDGHECCGTAEGHAFRRHELDALLNLAASGIGELCALQSQVLAA